MDRNGTGLEIVSVQLVEAAPPDAVLSSFEDLATARQDSVIYIKTESQTLALTFINDGTILLAGCTFDAGAAEGKITPSATLICGSFDMNYTMQLRSLFGVK